MGWCLEPSYSVWTFPSHFDNSFHNTHNSIPLIGFVSILTNKTLFIPNLSHLLAWITYPIATTFLSMFVMSWIILDKLLGAHTPASASILQNGSCTPQEKGFKVTNKGSSVGISLKHYLSKLETLTSRNDTVLRPTLTQPTVWPAPEPLNHTHLGTPSAPASPDSPSRLLGKQLHAEFVFCTAPATLHTNKSHVSILFLIIYPFLMVVRNDYHKCCLCSEDPSAEKMEPTIYSPRFFIYRPIHRQVRVRWSPGSIPLSLQH